MLPGQGVQARKVEREWSLLQPEERIEKSGVNKVEPDGHFLLPVCSWPLGTSVPKASLLLVPCHPSPFAVSPTRDFKSL